MVLLELGQKITNALSNFSKHVSKNDEAIKQLLNQIGLALIKSDINIKQVKEIQ